MGLYLPLLSRNCNVGSSLLHGNFPLSQTIFGCGRPSYEQSNSALAPVFRSILATDGKLFLNCNVTGSKDNKIFRKFK
jgi:hypothetical protein